MEKIKISIKRRLVINVLLPVTIVGVLSTVFLIEYISSPISIFLQNYFSSDLRLASKMGMDICEEKLTYLLELRLEEDTETVNAYKKESLNEIYTVASFFHEIHILVVERDKILGSSLGKINKLNLPPLLETENDSIIDLTIGGQEAKAHVQYFPLWQWQIFSFIHKKDYYDLINNARRIIIISSIGGILILFVTLLLVFHRKVNKPINRLIRFSSEIAAGNLEYELEIKRENDEFGILADSLRKMRDAIKTKISELSAMNKQLKLYQDHLETMVEERTAKLHKRGMELEKTNAELKKTQSQMLQREKMASIGQLAAGVAHEINNPMGFISSNIHSFKDYAAQMTEFIQVQSSAIRSLNGEKKIRVEKIRKDLDIDYIIEDISELIDESLDGTERVKEIVQNLKTFSHVDEEKYKEADINECIENTLKIIRNELKYKTVVKKEYDSLPQTRCIPQQLNQVFLNLLINASQAIDQNGIITIKTRHEGKLIKISISDNGKGIPAEIIDRIFEPFYTTKAVGEGTGLGLSIVYDIIKKHDGDIVANSSLGKGTEFIISLPVIGLSDAVTQ